MARTGKKEKALTPEEKLAQALVPDVEQTFRIPNNWKWCYLDSFTNIKTGKKDANYGSEGGKYYFFTCASETIRCDGYSFDGKFIILAGNGDIGNISIYNGQFEAYQRTYVLGVNEHISAEYVYYYFKYRWVDYNENKVFGTAIPYIRLGNLQFFPVPLPPFAEQQRIVDRIERLFAKLDEAKEKAQAVIDSYEDRKATILHKVFLGELTAEWRNKNQINKKQWMSKQLFAITENFDSKRIPLSKNERENLAKCYDYYGASGVIDQVDRYLFDGKYLLIGEDGANLVSRSTPIAFIAKGKFWVNNHAHVLSVKEEILMEFLCYYINSISLIPYVTGSAQPKMTQAKMNTIPIPVPTIDEQQEIINTLDGLFAEEKIAKEAAEQVRDQIDSMKKSILARAFRGELGTNDPTDESAVELLKRVLVEGQSDDTSSKPARTRTIIPKEIDSQLSTGMERDIIKLFIKTDNENVSMDAIMSISSKKFEILDTLRTLEKEGIIHKNGNGDYSLVK